MVVGAVNGAKIFSRHALFLYFPSFFIHLEQKMPWSIVLGKWMMSVEKARITTGGASWGKKHSLLTINTIHKHYELFFTLCLAPAVAGFLRCKVTHWVRFLHYRKYGILSITQKWGWNDAGMILCGRHLTTITINRIDFSLLFRWIYTLWKRKGE